MNLRRILFFIFAGLGLLTAAYSVQHWFMLAQGQFGESACNINEYWNCDKVSSSKYGDWFGIPIGTFALIYWAGVILLAFTQGTSRSLLRLLFIPPVIVNGLLALLLFSSLQLACITCYLNYFAWTGALIVIWNWKNPQWLKQKHTAIFWAAFTLLVIGWVAYQKSVTAKYANLSSSSSELWEGVSDEERQKFSQYFASLKKESIAIPTPFRYGDPQAPVIITEFSDFGCPHCARAATELVPELKQIKGVQVHFYPLPIDPACHPEFKGKALPNGRCEWAKGSVCAHQQDKFWEFHDLAFKGLLKTDRLVPFSWKEVHGLGLDQNKFEACMKSSEADRQVQDLIQASQLLNVQATPTFFINGRRFRGLLPIRAFKAAIAEAQKDALQK